MASWKMSSTYDAGINPPIRGSIDPVFITSFSGRPGLNPPIRGSIAMRSSKVTATAIGVGLNPPIRGSIENKILITAIKLAITYQSPIKGSIVAHCKVAVAFNGVSIPL